MTDRDARPYRGDDAAAVADLINVVAEVGGWHRGHIAAEIDEVVNSEVKDPATDTRVIIDADGRVLAAGLVPLPPAGGDQIELNGGVHPTARGAGIGRELLGWQLERAAALHSEVAPDTPWRATVASGVGDLSAIRLYERLGFTVARYFVEMSAPTTAPPLIGAPEDVRITPYGHDQDRAVHAVHMAAFRDQWGHQDRDFESWAALTVRSEAFRPQLSRLAFAGDTIVGYVLGYDNDVPGRFYLGQVGTAAVWRGRGVATSLLAEVLAAAGQAGYTHAALDTDADNPTGAAGIYAKVGFVTDQHIVVYHQTV